MMRLSFSLCAQRLLSKGAWRLLNFLLLLSPDHFAALELGERRALFDPHRVANPVLVGLVVGVVLLRPAHGLLHGRVRETPVDADDNRLVLLVADDDALERTLRHL